MKKTCQTHNDRTVQKIWKELRTEVALERLADTLERLADKITEVLEINGEVRERATITNL